MSRSPSVRVAVVIPCFDDGETLGEAIASMKTVELFGWPQAYVAPSGRIAHR